MLFSDKLVGRRSFKTFQKPTAVVLVIGTTAQTKESTMKRILGIILLFVAAILVAPAIQAVELVELPHPSPLPGERFGFDTAVCDGLMAVGRPYDAADGSVAIYQDGNIVDEVFYPGSPSGGAAFGHSVAMSSDCHVLAVGAPYTADTFGVAFVFERDTNGLFQLRQALPPTSPDGAGGQAGQSIAVSPSGDRIAVGAHPNGQVYIWERGSNQFFESLELAFSDWGPIDYVGYSLAFAGENRLLITAPLDTPVSGQEWSGSYYMFHRPGGPNSWAELWKRSTPGVFRVGWSVATSGDRFAVGGWGPSGSTNNGGEVYVYTLSASGVPTLEQKVTSPSPQAHAIFGNSVSLTGNHLLIGEPLRDVGGSQNIGAWNLFQRSGSGAQPWAPVYVAQTPSDADGAQYGFSVSSFGGTHVVGVPFSRVDGEQAGWAGYLVHSAIFADGFETGATDQWRQAGD